LIDEDASSPGSPRLRFAGGLAGAATGLASLLLVEPVGAGVIGAAGCLVLAAVSVTDLEQRIVPNRVILPALVAALVVQTIREPRLEWLLAALGAGGFFLLCALVYPAGLGMGDVKLAAFLGAWLGWGVGVALFLGSCLAVIPAVATLIRHGGAGRKMGLPYAPFLAAGGVIALFAAEPIIDAWLG
jgi:leader peptidase (prepilin peptidase)/N-methyltransferase